MPAYLAAFPIGAVAGLRSLTAPAAVGWAARAATPWILAALAAGEPINGKLPKTPSRKAPVPFADRIAMGGLAGSPGAAAGTPAGYEP